LEKFLSSQNNFSRTFWVPTQQRIGFYTNTHPAIPAQDFFKSVNNTQIFNILKTSELLLQESGVKYVIVPYDSQGEVFLKDRKYSHEVYFKTIEEVGKVEWLKRVEGFGRIAVFEVLSPRDHFWSLSQGLTVEYAYINPTKYILNVKNAKKGDVLVFSESFDKYWEARNESTKLKVPSVKYNKLFNSFKLERDGDYSFEVYYEPQKWVNIGVAISLVTLISVLGLLGIGLMGRKW